MSRWITSDQGFDIMTHWFLGYPEEDAMVHAGRCPLTSGDRNEHICGQPRSADCGDWPYCRPHADGARGRGGGDVPDASGAPQTRTR